MSKPFASMELCVPVTSNLILYGSSRIGAQGAIPRQVGELLLARAGHLPRFYQSWASAMFRGCTACSCSSDFEVLKHWTDSNLPHAVNGYSTSTTLFCTSELNLHSIALQLFPRCHPMFPGHEVP